MTTNIDASDHTKAAVLEYLRYMAEDEGIGYAVTYLEVAADMRADEDLVLEALIQLRCEGLVAQYGNQFYAAGGRIVWP